MVTVYLSTESPHKQYLPEWLWKQSCRKTSQHLEHIQWDSGCIWVIHILTRYKCLLLGFTAGSVDAAIAAASTSVVAIFLDVLNEVKLERKEKSKGDGTFLNLAYIK
jgi:hypothetical protein